MASGFTGKSGKKKLNAERSARITFKKAVVGDALVCLGRAIADFGLPFKEVSTQTLTMFGMQENPFVHYTTDCGVDIPYGAYEIEGLGRITPHATNSSSVVPELELSIVFEEKADESQWKALIEAAHICLAEHHSLFKNRAIKVLRPDDLVAPRYLDLSRELPMFFNETVWTDIDNNLFVPITHAAKLRELGIGGQRGILMHGKYGTGKSLVAYHTAQLCLQQDRTFILCDCKMLGAAVQISRFLEPSALFVEDFDLTKLVSTSLSELRNTLSGIEGKRGFDVITVLTTNFLKQVEEHDRSLLRPDRIDAIIEVTPPDTTTMGALVKHHLASWDRLEGEETDWKAEIELLVQQGATPAIVVEIIKRCKIAALRNDGAITPALLHNQAVKLARQIELSEPSPPTIDSYATRLADSLQAISYRGQDIEDS
jgi:hypothetical protein